MIKRRPPTKKDTISLEPNEIISQTIHINDGYALVKPGNYRIHFVGKTINGLPNSESVDFILQ